MSVIDLIKFNISVRKSDFLLEPQIYNTIMLNPDFNLGSIDNQMLQKISSKSFVSDKLIFNRIHGLDCILNGINFATGKKYNNFDNVLSYKYFFVSFYIVGGQVFSDGNHRTALYYLQSKEIQPEKSIKIIKLIDTVIRKINLSWDQIHEFVQILIDNLAFIKETKNISLQIDQLINNAEKMFI